MEGLHRTDAFPNLQPDDYQVTSPATPRYNCIAWAAGKDDTSWWPPGDFNGYYWPPNLARDATIESFVKAFERLGYQVCDNNYVEPDVDKVAIYADASGAPTHAARQLESGSWSSKLGKAQDIEHNTLTALEGGLYGHVARILKRPR
jgi:hypothetical protein